MDEEDLKKMIEVINISKQENKDQYQFDDFIDSEESDIENNLNDNEAREVELLTDFETFDVFNIYKHNPISSLKPEEKHLIDACEDSELKHLLFLNRKKNINLILLYKKLQDLIMECRQYIIEKASLLKEHINDLKLNELSGGAWKLAASYFKDKQLYQSPQNDDTKRKKSNNELIIYDLGNITKWSSFECAKIIKAVKLNYTFNKQQFMKAETKARNNQLASQKSSKKFHEIDTNQLEVPPLNSNEHIDWNRIASVLIQDKRTELECQSIWHLYLHPSLNKSPWTPEENKRLKAIAKKYKLQNWKKITLELGKDRSELSVCKHYFSNLSEKYKKGEFTYEEDKKLLQTVNMFKIDNYIPWDKVIKHFENRTRSQLYQRYTYYLSQDSKKRGTFTKAEDIMLMIFVDKFGRKFKKCVDYLPERSMVQCKDRFANCLERSLQKGNWTLEDDEKIMAHINKHGPQMWTELAKVMSRSNGQLRQRYFRIKHHLETVPNAKLSNVPRRGKSLTDQDGSYELCRSIADRYIGIKKMPTLREIEKILKTENMENGISSDDDFYEEKGDLFSLSDVVQDDKQTKQLDESLLDFFSNSYNISKTSNIDSLEFDKGVDDIELILKCLKVHLCIPDDIDAMEGLDPLDLRILSSLSERNTPDFKNITACQKFNSIQELVPPNFHSTVGLRSLLIKHLHFSHKKREISHLASQIKNPKLRQCITSDILNYSLNDRKEIQSERNLFYRRFHTLFKWSALMTLENPSSALLNISDFLPEKKVVQVKRTYSRVSCNEPNESVKKLKKSNPTTNPLKLIKLTPVCNKRVIQDLIINKSKKLFSVNKINQNGQVKTVLNEIKLDFVCPSIGSLNSVTSGNTTATTTKRLPTMYEYEKKVCVENEKSTIKDVKNENITVCIKSENNSYKLLELPSVQDNSNSSDSSTRIPIKNDPEDYDQIDKCKLEK